MSHNYRRIVKTKVPANLLLDLDTSTALRVQVTKIQV